MAKGGQKVSAIGWASLFLMPFFVVWCLGFVQLFERGETWRYADASKRPNARTSTRWGDLEAVIAQRNGVRR